MRLTCTPAVGSRRLPTTAGGRSADSLRTGCGPLHPAGHAPRPLQQIAWRAIRTADRPRAMTRITCRPGSDSADDDTPVAAEQCQCVTSVISPCARPSNGRSGTGHCNTRPDLATGRRPRSRVGGPPGCPIRAISRGRWVERRRARRRWGRHQPRLPDAGGLRPPGVGPVRPTPTDNRPRRTRRTPAGRAP